MNKNLVTSLELSKRLEKLGVKQESEFYWMKPKEKKYVLDESGLVECSLTEESGYYLGRASQVGLANCEDYCSAFLSGELGEMLPHRLNLPSKRKYTGEMVNGIQCRKSAKDWVVSYVNYEVSNELERGIHYEEGKTLAEVMGKMLVYLKENKLI